jgi:hypothetical protein
MNGVADSNSLNKPIKINLNIWMHIFYFLFFIFFYFFFGLGPAQPTWAGLDPVSPARSLAQTSDPAGPHEARVIQIMHAWPLLINSKQMAKMK